MPRHVIGGLIQAAAPITDPAAPIEKVRQAAIDAHVPFIEEAGKKGVQILGLEEIFNGPYFCPSQDAHWYDIAESVPGPTCELMAKFAKQYKMAMVVPVYEREAPGVYYNTAAVGDRRRALTVLMEARAAGACRRERLLHGLQQPRRHGSAVEHRPLLRDVLLCRSQRQLPRDGIRGQERARRRRHGPRHDRRSPP